MLRLKILLQSNYLYLLILVFSLFIAYLKINIVADETKYTGEEEIIIGKIINYVKKDDQHILIIRGQEDIRATFYTEENLGIELGMTIKLEGELYKPLNNTIPNTFNYKKYLNNRKIYWLMKVHNLNIINRNKNIIYHTRGLLQKRIDKLELTKHYSKAFILGDQSGLDSEVQETYRLNGVSHLFAISGMHFNLIAAVLMICLKKVRGKAIIIIIILVFYASLINQTGSIYRALIFVVLIYLSKGLHLNINSKNILFLTCSLLIIYNPLIIFDLGFQYSALVTYGLIISRKYYRDGYLYNLLMVSIFAFLFSLPITIYNFYEINLLSIINNLFFGPMISFIIYPLSLITLVFDIFEPLLYMFIQIMERLNTVLGSIDLFIIIIPKVNIIFYFTYFLLLITYLYSNNKKYLIISLILIFSFKLKYYLNYNTYVFFLDVGQGDSTLIYNNKEVILIDTGGNYNYQVSDNIITMLKSFGISKIDLLLLTHGDADHVLEAPHIIKNIKVEKVMINNNEVNKLEQRIIDVAPLIIDNYISTFDMQIFNHFIGSDENSSSIMTLFNIEGHTIFITGDAGRKEELQFLRENPIKIDILRIGHHGSRTSSDYNFLEQTEVKEAIISSGRNNRFNHPHHETIETLESLNIKYYNTATNGTLKYSFSKNEYTLISFPP